MPVCVWGLTDDGEAGYVGQVDVAVGVQSLGQVIVVIILDSILLWYLSTMGE